MEQKRNKKIENQKMNRKNIDHEEVTLDCEHIYGKLIDEKCDMEHKRNKKIANQKMNKKDIVH